MLSIFKIIAWSIFLQQNQYEGLYEGLNEGPNGIPNNDLNKTLWYYSTYD